MRKNGQPFSIRDWQIDIRTRASTNELPVWLRIKGGTTCERAQDADTEDGSSSDSVWAEPYVTKRNGSFSMECKRVGDPKTGALDPGQAELQAYADEMGEGADARLRMIDAIGNGKYVDVIVTGVTEGTDESSETISYDCEQVGATIPIPYVQATAVALKDGASEVAAPLALVVGTPKELTVAFTPATASNQKFAAYSSDPAKVSVAVSGSKLTLTPNMVVTEAVTITVRSMNNSLTDTCTATATAT